MPGCQRILRAIADDLTIMAAQADPAFRRRAKTLLATLPEARDDVITGACVDAITRSGAKGQDSSMPWSWTCTRR